MQSNQTPKPKEELHPAAKHVTSAREFLRQLHLKTSSRHPELQQAITELELALNLLTIKTGAVL
jgi:hypothetical protein